MSFELLLKRKADMTIYFFFFQFSISANYFWCVMWLHNHFFFFVVVVVLLWNFQMEIFIGMTTIWRCIIVTGIRRSKDVWLISVSIFYRKFGDVDYLSHLKFSFTHNFSYLVSNLCRRDTKKWKLHSTNCFWQSFLSHFTRTTLRAEPKSMSFFFIPKLVY